jgi:hypothetical protein
MRLRRSEARRATAPAQRLTARSKLDGSRLRKQISVAAFAEAYVRYMEEREDSGSKKSATRRFRFRIRLTVNPP